MNSCKAYRFIILILLVFSSCQKNGSSEEARQKISVCLKNDPSSLDPRIGVDSSSESVLRTLFTGLTFTDKDNKTALALAESYDLSPDRKTYTFLLKDTKWSDGSPLTARDFEETWKGLLDPKFQAPNCNLFYYIKNARAVKCGEMPVEAVGIRALDDRTLQVELEHPHASFLDMLANTTFYPIHARMRQNPADPSSLVSCGPFQLKSYQFQNEIVVAKNPFYFDAANTKLDEIHYFIIKDERTAYLLFEKGEVDFLGTVLGGIAPDLEPYLAKQPLWRHIPIAGASWIAFNPKAYPLHNKKIRKALAFVIDRKSIAENILQNSAEPALSLIPKIQKKERWHPYFPDAAIAQAQQLFAEGLAEENLTLETFPVLKLTFAAQESNQKTMLALQAQWKKYLGIKVDLQVFDFPTLLQKMMNKEFQIGRIAWRVQYDDPGNLLELFQHEEYPHNHAGWKNEEFNTLLLAAKEAPSEEQRWACLEKAEALLMEDMVICPICHHESCSIQKPYLKDVVASHLNTTDFRWAHIEK